MKEWLYKWLPILCGCHCRSDRSFHWHGTPFPVCARCTGELVGGVAALLTCWFFRPDAWMAAVLMIPMLLDGGIQMATKYESTNWKRVVTGTLFGYGLCMLALLSFLAVFRFGYRIGAGMVN